MYVCEQDSEDEIEVHRRSSHRSIKILDDSESEGSELRSIRIRGVEIEVSEDENASSFKTPHKLAEDVITEFKACLPPTEGKLDEKTSPTAWKESF